MQMQGFSQEADQQQLNVTTISKTGKNDNECEIMRRVVIHQVALDDTDELERMSRFCIDAFYGDGDEDGTEGSLLSRKWKEIRLGAMQKAQLLDISLSTADNRCIFVAKDVTTTDNTHEIIGCCEVIEEKLDVLMATTTATKQPMSSSSTTARSSSSERERRKTARPRPIIENLCVKGEYRRSGVGIALLHACETAVHRLWGIGQDQIFAQVLEDNHRAYGLFVNKCGYQFLFEDPTCTEVVLDDTLFAKEVVVTKRMLRKFL